VGEPGWSGKELWRGERERERERERDVVGLDSCGWMRELY